MTDYLTSHIYLAGVAVFTAYTAGADSEAFAASAKAVDTNSKDISKAVGSIAGKEKGDAFYTSWAAHVTDFVNYAVSAPPAPTRPRWTPRCPTSTPTASRSARSSTASPAGSSRPPRSTDEFKVHIETTAGTIDSLKAALVK